MYKLKNSNAIIRIYDGAVIPKDAANTDYANYMEWLAEGNTPIPADVPTLAQVKAEQIAKINQSANAAFDVITSPYPQHEIATWPNQYAEAWALQSDPNAYTPTLTAIATQVGITASTLATSVLQKAAAYTQASGAVVGKRKKLTDQINAATTSEQVNGIAW